MYEFSYHRPKSLDEARSIREQAEDGTYLSGGMTLLPTMKQRLAAPSDLIDLGQLDELRGISVNPNKVTIGALTIHQDVQYSSELQSVIPALAELAGMIGDPQVRNRGTLGGSLANNDPAADYPAAVLALKATITTNQRDIPADDFFKGLFETALDENEIITSVTFAVPERAAYTKFPNQASRYALVGVFVAQFADGIRVVVTGAGPGVFRVGEMEEALSANFSPEAVADIAIPQDDLNSDIHASAEYRAHLVTVFAKRAVSAALG